LWNVAVKRLSLAFGCLIGLTFPAISSAQGLGHRAAVPPRVPTAKGPLAGKAVSQVVSTQPHPSVVRIIVVEKDGQSLGSGTLVDVHDPYALVITNWHVIRDAAGEISVVFPNGFRSAARVVKHDSDWDLAALSIWKPDAAAVRISREPPKPGDPLTIAGYGSDGTYRAVSGRCTQYLSPSEKHPHEMVELAAAARQGDSGGPIFNRQGDLAGVLFGSVDNTTSGSYGGRVLQFLEPLLAADSAVSVPPGTQPPAKSVPKSADQDPLQVTLPGIDDKLTSVNPTVPAQPAAPLAAVDAASSLPDEDAYLIEHTTLDTASPSFGPVGPASTGLTVQTFLGQTPIEQAKAALSIVGLGALLMLALRWGKERKSEE
jgi:hypothetical protein